jgi:hypothetical protein
MSNQMANDQVQSDIRLGLFAMERLEPTQETRECF